MFKYEKSKETGFILFYEFNFDNRIKHKSYVISATKYKGIEKFNDIIKQFNGFDSSEPYNESMMYMIIKFDNEEDCKNCCEYLNSILIMNKLIN